MRQVQADVKPALNLTTRGRAHRTWRTLEARLEAVRQEVQRNYQEVLSRVPTLISANPPPLFRTVLAWISQPLDPSTLKLRQRLVYAFAGFGTSFWRPLPASLRLDLREYAHRLETICLKGWELSRQLGLAGELLRFFQRHSPRRSSPHLRVTLTDPEAMRLMMLLTERQSLIRQLSEIALGQSLQARLATCHRWLALLKPQLPTAQYIELQDSLVLCEAARVNTSNQHFSHFTSAHAQLDEIIRQISSLSK